MSTSTFDFSLKNIHTRGSAAWHYFKAKLGNSSAGSRQQSLPRFTAQVLLQTDTFQVGGLETVIIDIARCFKKSNIDIAILVFGPLGPAAEAVRQHGITILSLAFEPQSYRLALKQWGVKTVFAHYSVNGSNECNELGIPFVQVIHNCYGSLEPFATRFKQAEGNVNGFVAVSEAVARHARSVFGHQGKCVVIPNGSDLTPFQTTHRETARRLIRSRHGIPFDSFVFLVAANFYAQKNHRGALEAFRELLANHVHATLLIIGNTGDRQSHELFADDVKRHRLQRHVIHVGHTFTPHLYFLAADALLQASLWEGGSLAVQEALVARIPIVSTNVGTLMAEPLPDFIHISRLPYSPEEVRSHAPDFLHERCQHLPQDLAQHMLSCIHFPRHVPFDQYLESLLDHNHAYTSYVDLFRHLCAHGNLSSFEPIRYTWLDHLTSRATTCQR
jgi:glycosyltransferase involved in cell wall biosynthesis